MTKKKTKAAEETVEAPLNSIPGKIHNVMVGTYDLDRDSGAGYVNVTWDDGSEQKITSLSGSTTHDINLTVARLLLERHGISPDAVDPASIVRSALPEDVASWKEPVLQFEIPTINIPAPETASE